MLAYNCYVTPVNFTLLSQFGIFVCLCICMSVCMYIQVGDRVYYVPQAHELYLNDRIAANGNAQLGNNPWRNFPEKWPLVECVILNLAYDFPGALTWYHCLFCSLKTLIFTF